MQVHTTKYDGSLHYRFPTQPIHVGDDLLALHLLPGTPLESYRGPQVMKHHLLMLQWPGRPWKLSVRWDRSWTPHDHYVDIITPADWSDDTLRLTDLDLDLIQKPGLDLPLIDDADEFERHIDRFGYPAVLVDTCLRAVLEVSSLIRRKRPPFDGALYGWRPGQPVPSFESACGLGR